MRWLLRRWWLWAGMGFILAAVMAGYLLMPVSEGLFSRATYDKVKVGMKGAQLEELLEMMKGELDDTTRTLRWEDEDGNRFDIEIDPGRQVVTGKTFTPTDVPLIQRMKGRSSGESRRSGREWPPSTQARRQNQPFPVCHSDRLVRPERQLGRTVDPASPQHQ